MAEAWLRYVFLAVVAQLCIVAPTWALDLLESYDAALTADAEYRAARAAAESGRELLPLARAQLLPSISLSAARMHNDLTTQTQNLLGQPVSFDSQYISKNYALSLRQPLYRPQLYSGYLQAIARVEGVEAVFDKAGQELAIRVMAAYLNVLLAEEGLRQVESQRAAIEAQLAAAQRALAAGQGTRTDIDDAQARLDLNQARHLGARQQIEQARHELAALIDRPIGPLRLLDGRRLVLRAPQPEDLAAWIARAESASPELREARARIEAARHEVDRARGGHKPTLDLVVQRSVSASDNVTNPNNRYDNNQIGVQVVVPLFAGGYVDAQVRQAQAALEEAEERYEAARRKLANQVRKEFQGVQQGILKIRALEIAERSAEQSVLSNEKGYLAGTRSRLDILNAQEARANTRLELARERLLYVMSHARLLSLCGALDRAAIAEMNLWLAE
ncbi:MAG: TolC family outer membrane protein [Rhodocyclaceae bacterium]